MALMISLKLILLLLSILIKILDASDVLQIS